MHAGPVCLAANGLIDKTSVAERLTKIVFIRVWETLAEADAETDFQDWMIDSAQDAIWDHFHGKRTSTPRSKKISVAEIERVVTESFSDQNDASEPNPALWREIQAHIETEDIAPVDRKKPARIFRFRYAAMLVMILVIGRIAYMTAESQLPLMDSPPPTDARIPGPITDASAPMDEALPQLAPEVLQLQNQYTELKSELVATVDIDEDEHDTDIQTDIEGDLDLVEKSISEIVGALGDDPENEVLEEMLVTTYKKQIKLVKKFLLLSD